LKAPGDVIREGMRLPADVDELGEQAIGLRGQSCDQPAGRGDARQPAVLVHVQRRPLPERGDDGSGDTFGRALDLRGKTVAVGDAGQQSARCVGKAGESGPSQRMPGAQQTTTFVVDKAKKPTSHEQCEKLMSQFTSQWDDLKKEIRENSKGFGSSGWTRTSNPPVNRRRERKRQ
jgi:hypothetical protein